MKHSWMLGVLALLLPSWAQAQKLPLPTRALLSPGSTYTAQLRTLAFSGQVVVQGATWSCAKGQCRTQARWSAPTVAACAALAAKAGEVTRFGNAKTSLDAGELASCNRGTMAMPKMPTVGGRAAAAVPASPAAAAMSTRKHQQFRDLRRTLEQSRQQAEVERQREEREEARTRRLALGYTHRHGQGRDCDDRRIEVNPFATEICDHIDNNCNGLIDEGAQLAFYLDADGDAHGDPGQRILACPVDQQRASSDGRWLVSVGNDCNDSDPNQWQGCP